MRNRSFTTNLVVTYLYFLYFSICTHLLMKLSHETTFIGLRQSLYMSMLWLIPVLMFPRRAKPIAGIIGILLWITSTISLGYYCIYQQTLSTSVLFVVFESNIRESSEFVGQYFRWWMLAALCVHTLIAVLLWSTIKPFTASLRSRSSICVGIIVFLFILPIAGQCFSKKCSWDKTIGHFQVSMEPAQPWSIIMGYALYRNQLQEMENLRQTNAALPPLADLVDHNPNHPSTLVLIIGESTNRSHMGLYGYSRNTTPRLSALKSELLVFDKVVASRPTTIESLTQVLSFADEEHPDLYLKEPTLMNMMKQAGYKSYWITNQQTLTKRNTMLTNFSQQTDEQHYMNTSREQNSDEYDTDVLPPLERVLEQRAPKKFIVIHLLGAHMKYEYRYPKEFNFFKDRTGISKPLDNDKLANVNQYDNAILFNDYVVSSIIEAIKKSGTPSLMVYFSDHGEDVYDSPPHNFDGRNEASPTTPMYTIPFIIWHSAAWQFTDQQLENLQANLHRPYTNANFIHTWADVADISFEKWDPTKSLASQHLKDYPLIIGDPSSRKNLHILTQ